MTFSKNRVRNFLLDHIIEILLIILVVAMTCVSDTFFTVNNIMNIFRNQALKGVIAFGMTMVIIAGQIDLSIGSQVALAGVIVAGSAGTCPAPPAWASPQPACWVCW